MAMGALHLRLLLHLRAHWQPIHPLMVLILPLYSDLNMFNFKWSVIIAFVSHIICLSSDSNKS